MLVAGFPADAFGTNCYVLAPAAGEQCLIVDPGIGVLGQLDEMLARYHLHPAAVLLTHGHLDHTFSVAPVCGARGVTAYIHPDDRELLADPAKGLSTDLASLFGGRLPYSEPEDVAPLTDGATLKLAGLELTVAHAPGHTRGSVLFRLSAGVRHPRGRSLAVPSMVETPWRAASCASPVTCSSPVDRRTDCLAACRRCWPACGEDPAAGGSDRGPARPRAITSIGRSAPTIRTCARWRRRGRRPGPTEDGRRDDQTEATVRLPGWLPPQRIIEQQIVERIRRTFELHGFSPLQTRAVEPLDQLLQR